ncbi:MAG: biotin carboxylase [Gammaproteobacteria bacterium]|nr:biotin carboxylase [Gammaproteobacteria bacterium]
MFRRVFIANRGVVARRIVRACSELGVESVAAYSDLDRAAPHVAEATASARLPGYRAADTYVNIERVIAAAKSAGADALHPGYGFLAENPDFASRVAAAGIAFIGPAPDAIRTFGEKTGARRHMEQAGFPVAPGSELIEDERALSAAARRIGWPVMLKPAAGGGGIGMRVARSEAELVAAFASAKALAQGAFGNAAVYLEALLPNPRHIELQMLGDGERVRCVGERECSVQRRHQKVIEEAPAPGVRSGHLADIGERAVAALEATGYTSLGTVETLLAKRRFAFLEVNTRLQVEHGVTEEVTGLDLVQLQIRLAAGERLDELLPPERAPLGGCALAEVVNDSEPVGQQLRSNCRRARKGAQAPARFAVQARIYAEDSRRMLPSTGTLSAYRPPRLTGVRVEAGYAEGQAMTPYYDPLLAKVIGTGATRELAIGRTLVGVKAFEIRGVDTNRDLLQAILRHPDFLAGKVHTGWLESRLKAAPAPAGAPLLL